MAQLDGTGRTVDVAPGYRIVAPGLVGTATARQRRPAGSPDRGPELVTAAFDRAAEAGGLREVMNVDLDVREVPAPASAPVTRTMQGEDGLVLETPDLGDDVGQVVLAVDEAGAVTWNFPESVSGSIEPPPVRGAGGHKRFVIRRTTPLTAPGGTSAADRGLFGALGRKVLKVLVYPVTDAVLGPVTEHFAHRWESRQRPYLVRDFAPDSFRTPAGAPITGPQWERLGEGPSLLFVHGTFSSSHGAFHGLSDETMAELHRRYAGRVFAFDHFTLSHSPEQNVAELATRVPSGLRLTVDVVSHSRGGLVTRVMAGELGTAPTGLAVRRAVFVATPNAGTALADADHMVAFIDRYTSILNLVPPGPLDVVTDMLEVIITAVKVIGHAFLTGLPGLTSMDPSGDFIARLNSGTAAPATYYALAADYEPTGGLRTLVRKGVVDHVVDRVFDRAANDLVVPTLGVWQAGADPAFPIADERLLSLPATHGVEHTGFFRAPQTSERLLSWLSA